MRHQAPIESVLPLSGGAGGALGGARGACVRTRRTRIGDLELHRASHTQQSAVDGGSGRQQECAGTAAVCTRRGRPQTREPPSYGQAASGARAALARSRQQHSRQLPVSSRTAWSSCLWGCHVVGAPTKKPTPKPSGTHRNPGLRWVRRAMGAPLPSASLKAKLGRETRCRAGPCSGEEALRAHQLWGIYRNTLRAGTDAPHATRKESGQTGQRMAQRAGGAAGANAGGSGLGGLRQAREFFLQTPLEQNCVRESAAGQLQQTLDYGYGRRGGVNGRARACKCARRQWMEKKTLAVRQLSGAAVHGRGSEKRRRVRSGAVQAARAGLDAALREGA